MVSLRGTIRSINFSAFDVAEYLDTEEAIAAYLKEVVAEGGHELLRSAHDDIARPRRMTKT
jgi:probable addiction module antidote protein